MLKHNLPETILGKLKRLNFFLPFLKKYITTVVLSANLGDTQSPLHPSCWVKVDEICGALWEL